MRIVAKFRIPLSLLLGALVTRVTLASPPPTSVIHVPGDFPTIQEAIDAAPEGSEILVAPGSYKGPLNTNLNFNGKALELKSSGGPEVTIIDGQADGHRGFIFQSGETASAIVDGFTITRGYYSIFRNNSSPTIRNCIFSRSFYLAVSCDNSSPIFSQCKFLDNPEAASASALECINNSFPTIDECLFARNDASGGLMGGGISVRFSSLRVSNSVFRDNDAEGGGGIAAAYSSVFIDHCDFQGNVADNKGGAGIHLDHSTATITNSRFFDNRVCFGGALNSWSSTVTVSNCSFAANGGCYQVGGFGTSGTLTLENTIIAWGAGSALLCSGTVTLRCCDIFGNQGGDWTECLAGQLGIEGNFARDPQFCDIAIGDLTLQGSSPCLPGNHPQGEDCGLIGAFDQGCGPTAVELSTWGAVKAAFSPLR